MADISRVVKVDISLRTGAAQAQTFSDLLLLMQHGGEERVSAITRPDQLLGEPFDLATSSAGYKAALAAFGQRPSPREVYIGKRGSAEGVQEALAACASASKNWYGFTDVAHAAADVLGAAAWAQGNKKMFLTTLTDPKTITSASDDLATQLKTNGYDRTTWFYHPQADAFPEVAAAGIAFQTPPGGEVWAYLRLAGVPSVNLSETAYLNVVAKNGNTFEPMGNNGRGQLNLTQRGITAGGEWVDIVRFADWQCDDLRVEVFNVFVRGRVPYDDFGIKSLEDAMIRSLERGRRRGGIALDTLDEDDKVVPGYVTYVPREIDVSTADKAARRLVDTGFRARLRGAILNVEIQGELQYDRIAPQAA